MEATRLLKNIVLCTLIFSGLFFQTVEAKNYAANRTFHGFGTEIDGYIQYAARRYRVSETMLRGLIKMEDGWNGNISPTGATGVGQFTVSTWNWLALKPEGQAIGMRPITSRTKGTRLDPRRNKYINTLATGLLVRWHIDQFRERGITISDANLYMAHNIGLDGLHRALQGKSTAEDIRNMRHNGMKRGMSVSAFLSYQKGRYEQHKAEANFLTTNTSLQFKNLNWIEPNDKSIAWVQPQTQKVQRRNDGLDDLVWVNPQ
ncbi:transglycosylase SLT domain-containing protein [Exercitatus varius]|uniref:transglycosylase SLT domain-containing protein n=1 Tax=Exercitatus varius TaxID=67857 RepID=UPI00294AC24E|nr:transglycosylase SLT domain-containing protein [Exercitatus varius]MDG2961721.1 transglycosylase SLT domain-containing protein [Exercitatus varius]